MEFSEKLIAPCGINCGVCIAYLREKNKCCGCKSDGTKKAAHCSTCSIKLCDEHSQSEFIYCFDCRKFPCAKIKNLDKRYVQKYHLPVIESLTNIRQHGLAAFINSENEKWKCKRCGEVLCVHRNYCLKCGKEYR